MVEVFHRISLTLTLFPIVCVGIGDFARVFVCACICICVHACMVALGFGYWDIALTVTDVIQSLLIRTGGNHREQ